MARRFIIFVLPLFLVAICGAERASADHPSRLVPYRFLPRFSTLTEFRGPATDGVDFRVLGKFDLLLDDDHVDPWGYTATFENVNAWAAHPILAYVLDLNDVLGLDRLVGEQLPVLGPFDAYRFTGFTRNGSSVDLFATVIGPWFHLRGDTVPATDDLNSLSYHINALARTRPWADFNADGIVDGADLTVLRDNYGRVDLDSQSIAYGDADVDGDVDGRDFLQWQRQSGETPPLDLLEAASASLAAGLSSVTTVPEPGTLWLVGVGMIVFGLRRRV